MTVSYVHELVNEWARCTGKYAATVYNYTDHLIKLGLFLLLGHHFLEIKIDKLQNSPIHERDHYSKALGRRVQSRRVNYSMALSPQNKRQHDMSICQYSNVL